MARTIKDFDQPDSPPIAPQFAGEEERARLFQTAVPEFQSGQWTFDDCEVLEIRKQRKKRIVHYRLSYRDEAGEGRTADVIGKVYGSDRGAKAFRVLRDLWESGFRAPIGYQVPRAYGYSSAEGTLLQGMAEGRDWAGSLESGPPALRWASERAAEWLVALQRVVVSGYDSPTTDGPEAERYAAELEAAHPERRPQLHDLAGVLAERFAGEGGDVVASHGDYHPKNIFVAPMVTTVIDFDTFAQRRPAYDVGYAIGQLLVMSYFRTASFEAGVFAARAFWARYREEGGPADWSDVSTYVGRTLMQSLHYELCTLRNGRIGLLELWPRLAQSLLSSDGEEALEDTIRNL